MLSELKILDLSRLLPGPFASMILADLGAQVIKIEDPRGGDYLRHIPPRVGEVGAMFAALNRGKRSLALDLKAVQGRELFLRLLDQGYDLVLESFRPGVMERLGLSYDLLRARNPRVILCSISGFGDDFESGPNPDRERAGHDLGFLARSGVLSLLARQGEAPVVPGLQIADLAGGAYPAVAALLAAVVARDQSGEGRAIEISMRAQVQGLLAPALAVEAAGGESLRAGETLLGGGVPAYGVYRCADGKQMALAALEPKFWKAFCERVGHPEFLGRGLERGESGEALREALSALFAERSQAAWQEALVGCDCCCEPVLGPMEAWERAQALGGGPPVVEARLPEGGKMAVMGSALSLSLGAQRPLPTQVPALGEHTMALLERLGVSQEEREALVQAGTVGGPGLATP